MALPRESQLFAIPRSTIRSVYAGFELCFGEPSVCRLAMKPWIYGAALLVLLLTFGLYYLHPIAVEAVELMIGATGSLHEMISIVVGVLLFAFLLLWGFVLVLLLTICFQDPVAQRVLEVRGILPPRTSQSLTSGALNIGVSLLRGLAMALLLLPLLIFSFVISFFPPLIPVAFVITVWVIAIQFFDSAWEALDISFMGRLSIAFRNFYVFFCYGTAIFILCLVPFAIFVLPPIAVAGAADLVWRLKLSEPTTKA